MLVKDKMMASELVAELERLIKECGDQPVEISVDSNRQNDRGILRYDSAYIRNKSAGEYPVSGGYQHFRINARLENDRKIVRQKGEAA
tara:strand:- start:384 stop:647 length:264 start_codon:yes stop_codon:yes gene_type:complete